MLAAKLAPVIVDPFVAAKLAPSYTVVTPELTLANAAIVAPAVIPIFDPDAS